MPRWSAPVTQTLLVFMLPIRSVVLSPLEFLTPWCQVMMVVSSVGLPVIILCHGCIPHTFFSYSALVHKFRKHPDLHRCNKVQNTTPKAPLVLNALPFRKILRCTLANARKSAQFFKFVSILSNSHLALFLLKQFKFFGVSDWAWKIFSIKFCVKHFPSDYNTVWLQDTLSPLPLVLGIALQLISPKFNPLFFGNLLSLQCPLHCLNPVVCFSGV